MENVIKENKKQINVFGVIRDILMFAYAVFTVVFVFLSPLVIFKDDIEDFYKNLITILYFVIMFVIVFTNFIKICGNIRSGIGKYSILIRYYKGSLILVGIILIIYALLRAFTEEEFFYKTDTYLFYNLFIYFIGLLFCFFVFICSKNYRQKLANIIFYFIILIATFVVFYLFNNFIDENIKFTFMGVLIVVFTIVFSDLCCPLSNEYMLIICYNPKIVKKQIKASLIKMRAPRMLLEISILLVGVSIYNYNKGNIFSEYFQDTGYIIFSTQYIIISIIFIFFAFFALMAGNLLNKKTQKNLVEEEFENENYSNESTPKAIDDTTGWSMDLDKINYKYYEDISLSDLLTNMKKYFSQNSVTVDDIDIISYLAAMSSSKFIILKGQNISAIRDFVKLFASFFGQTFFYEEENQLWISDGFTRYNDGKDDYISEVIKGIYSGNLRKGNITPILLERIKINNMNSYFKILAGAENSSYANEICVGKAVRGCDFVKNSILEVGDNCFYNFSLNEGERFNKITRQSINKIVITPINFGGFGGDKVLSQNNTTITWQTLKRLFNSAKTEVCLSEAYWAIIDRISDFLKIKIGEGIDNRARLKIEKYVSVFLILGEKEDVAFDYALANIVLPKCASLLGEQIYDESVSGFYEFMDKTLDNSKFKIAVNFLNELKIYIKNDCGVKD